MPDDKDTNTDNTKKRRFKAGQGGAATELTEKRGINRFPQWLTRDKGLPDWLAGTVVVIAGGLLMTAVVALLILIFPVK